MSPVVVVLEGYFFLFWGIKIVFEIPRRLTFLKSLPQMSASRPICKTMMEAAIK